MNTTMKPLIKHFWTTNRDTILAKSVRNCHCENVHSIVLSDAPGSMIRLFYAVEGHDLANNCPTGMIHGLSIGFHNHHCDITLVPVIGTIINWMVSRVSSGMPVREFCWDSKLLGGKGAFEFISESFVRTVRIEEVSALNGQSVHMKYDELHTVSVGIDNVAAWLVLEGKEDPNYKPACYSNMPLYKMSFGHLYKPMEPNYCEQLISSLIGSSY